MIAGTEARIADDDEILARGPHIIRGYWKQPETTDEVLDEEGWVATGDLGDATDDGFLIVTGRKKDLFKLSTGKYVTPEALAQALEAAEWIEHALVVGDGEKYCAALVIVSRDELANRVGDDVRRDDVRDAISQAVCDAQRELPKWSQARRIALVPDELTREEGMLTPKLSKQRPRMRESLRRGGVRPVRPKRRAARAVDGGRRHERMTLRSVARRSEVARIAGARATAGSATAARAAAAGATALRPTTPGGEVLRATSAHADIGRRVAGKVFACR